MEVLKKQREEHKKQKKALTTALRMARKQKSRIIKKATTLTKDDIVAILCFKNEQESKKFAKLQAQASTSNPPAVEDLSEAAADSQQVDPDA